MFNYEVFNDREHYKIGLKESIKALKADKVKTLFIAKDADGFVLRRPKEALGNLCKIDISAAIAVVIK
jgi:ribosomal protein L7Ae-like RNA K-turn-binding protein